MPSTRPFTELSERVRADPVRRQRIEAQKRAINDVLELARVRMERGLTQTEVAQTLDQTQANVSRVERSADMYLSTLEDYVTALGGKHTITAVFPDAAYPLHPVTSDKEELAVSD